MELKKESFKKMFPNLAKELQTDKNKVRVDSVRRHPEDSKKAAPSQDFNNRKPDVIDFIRRCDREEQAEEIIRYMEKRGEIDKTYAQKLRRQLREKGVRSFGTRKEHDYYLKHRKALT